MNKLLAAAAAVAAEVDIICTPTMLRLYT